MRALHFKFESAESLSVNLMTFGLLEPMMTVAMLKDRAVQRAHLLTVWFDAEEMALAYVWTKSPCNAQIQEEAACNP